MKQMLQVRVNMHYIGDDAESVSKIDSRKVVVRNQVSMTALSEGGQNWAGTLWPTNIG